MAEPRAYTIEQLADVLACSSAALYRRRVGDRLVFDDGQTLPLIRFGRRMRVPAAAVARLLGETPVTATENAAGPGQHRATTA